KDLIINVLEALELKADNFDIALFEKFIDYEWYGIYSHDPEYIRIYLRILQYAINHDKVFAGKPKVVFLPNLDIDYSQFGFNYFDFTNNKRKSVVTNSNIYIINTPKGFYWKSILALSEVPLVTGDNSVTEALANRQRFFYEIEPHKADFATSLRDMARSGLTEREIEIYSLLLFHNLPAYLSSHHPQFNRKTLESEIETMFASLARIFTDSNAKEIFIKIGNKVIEAKGNVTDKFIRVIQKKEWLQLDKMKQAVDNIDINI
ncbi:MAG: hypothetical protein KKD11_00085, partial [Candidatus Omnitrophica bacterium]|nr:hypothetical protein [Candidatus Omnitrophota bacterium]